MLWGATVSCTFLWCLVHIRWDLCWSSYNLFDMMTNGDMCLQLLVEMCSFLVVAMTVLVIKWNLFSIWSGGRCVIGDYFYLIAINCVMYLPCHVISSVVSLNLFPFLAYKWIILKYKLTVYPIPLDDIFFNKIRVFL